VPLAIKYGNNDSENTLLDVLSDSKIYTSQNWNVSMKPRLGTDISTVGNITLNAASDKKSHLCCHITSWNKIKC